MDHLEHKWGFSNGVRNGKRTAKTDRDNNVRKPIAPTKGKQQYKNPLDSMPKGYEKAKNHTKSKGHFNLKDIGKSISKGAKAIEKFIVGEEGKVTTHSDGKILSTSFSTKTITKTKTRETK